ncbi:MAG: hypothetical protein ACI4NP_04900 [Thermoguttaceae bacterium]
MNKSFRAFASTTCALLLVVGTTGCQTGWSFHNPFAKTPKAEQAKAPDELDEEFDAERDDRLAKIDDITPPPENYTVGEKELKSERSYAQKGRYDSGEEEKALASASEPKSESVDSDYRTPSFAKNYQETSQATVASAETTPASSVDSATMSAVPESSLASTQTQASLATQAPLQSVGSASPAALVAASTQPYAPQNAPIQQNALIPDSATAQKYALDAQNATQNYVATPDPYASQNFAAAPDPYATQSYAANQLNAVQQSAMTPELSATQPYVAPNANAYSAQTATLANNSPATSTVNSSALQGFGSATGGLPSLPDDFPSANNSIAQVSGSTLANSGLAPQRQPETVALNYDPLATSGTSATGFGSAVGSASNNVGGAGLYAPQTTTPGSTLGGSLY